MGFFKLLLNLGNAEGIREAMRIAYRQGQARGALNMTPHFSGLFHALGSRYSVNGVEVPVSVLLSEVAPFMLIPDPEVGVEALCEYVVYKERPIDAKLDGLKHVLNYTISNMGTADPVLRRNTAAGLETQMGWVHLLDWDVKRFIGSDKDQLAKEHAAWIENRRPIECESQPGRAALKRAIQSGQKITLITRSSSSPTAKDEVIPQEIRFIGGAECLIGFSSERGGKVQFPLHTIALPGAGGD